MQRRLAQGNELLRYFVIHGYVIVDNEFGQVIVSHRNEIDTLTTPINIPTNQPIPPKLLRHLLARGGFTEKAFWEEIGE